MESGNHGPGGEAAEAVVLRHFAGISGSTAADRGVRRKSLRWPRRWHRSLVGNTDGGITQKSERSPISHNRYFAWSRFRWRRGSTIGYSLCACRADRQGDGPGNAPRLRNERRPTSRGARLSAAGDGLRLVWNGFRKWLTRIEISMDPFKGYFQQDMYVAENTNGQRRTITRMRVNSKFLRPLDGEEISGKLYHIEGVAWAGENKISKVDLRFDNKEWEPAVLGPSVGSMVWTPWSFEWKIPRADHYSIEVRATDDSGNSQPQVRDPNRKDAYELNTPHRIAVNCRS